MKESLINLDKSVIFRETFNSESDVKNNSGSPTNVSFNNSFASFNGSSSIITYPGIERSINTISFLILLNSTTEDIINLSSSHSITISSGTISANGFSSPTIYVNGTQTATITSGSWVRITIVTSTSFIADDVQIGFVSSYLDGNLDNLIIFNRVLVSDEVDLLYENALYRVPVIQNTVINVDSRLGLIFDPYGNTITKTDVEILKDGAIYGVLYPDGTNARLDAGTSINLQLNNNLSCIFWFKIGTLEDVNPYICYLGEEELGKRRIIVLTGAGIINFNSFGAGNMVSSINAYGNNIWHCGIITVEKSTKEVSIYVDGVLDNSGVLNDLNDYDITTNGLIIGNSDSPFTAEFEGKISIFQLSSHLLNNKEVANYYNSTKNYFNR